MKTGYQMWLDGELRDLGSFLTALFEAYLRADGNNRMKLDGAFPEWFK